MRSSQARARVQRAVQRLAQFASLVASSRTIAVARLEPVFALRRLYNPHYYAGELSMQLGIWRRAGSSKRDSVLAVGGRYDALLSRFRPLPTLGAEARESGPLAGVGLCVAVDKLVMMINRAALHSQLVQEARLGASIQVVVAALGERDLMAERLLLLERLWEAELPAGIAPQNVSATLNDLVAYCVERGCSWLVMLKDKTLRETRSAKVRAIWTRSEIELELSEVVSYICRHRETTAHEVAHHGLVGGGGAAASTSTNAVDVRLVTTSPNRRIRRAISEAALRRVEGFVEGIGGLDVPLVVIAIDKVPAAVVFDCVAQIRWENFDDAALELTWVQRHGRHKVLLAQLAAVLASAFADGYAPGHSGPEERHGCLGFFAHAEDVFFAV